MNKASERIRLAHPSFGKEAYADVRAALASGHLTRGALRDRFEAATAEYLGVPFAVSFNSGTSALFAALKARGIGPGDRVAIPDYGFVATANAVALCGADPVFCDVEPETFSLSPRTLEQAGGDFSAIVVVHQFGLPAPVDDIIAAHPVVEDAACALGTRIHGRPLGAQSGLGVFSFHPRKVVTTGEGGMLVTGDRGVADRARAFSDHGVNPGTGAVTMPGGNLRLPELSCALGLDGLRRLTQTVEARAAIGRRYADALRNVDRVRFPARTGDPAWNHQTFALVFAEKADRDGVAAKLGRYAVEARPPAASLSAHEYYREKYHVPAERVAVSRRLAERALAIPCHEGMREEHVERVLAVLLRALEAA